LGSEKKKIETILKDYHWMMNSIKLERGSLNDSGGSFTAKYGIESSLPKANGNNSDPVFKETLRREKRWGRIVKYEKKVQLIQERIHNVDDERENEVLHWLLEGKSLRWIAYHMGLSPAHIHRLKNSIVEKCSNETNGTNDTNCIL
jgi:DNA-directed RNA polymerase specialized sigma subunit